MNVAPRNTSSKRPLKLGLELDQKRQYFSAKASWYGLGRRCRLVVQVNVGIALPSFAAGFAALDSLLLIHCAAFFLLFRVHQPSTSRRCRIRLYFEPPVLLSVF